MSESKIFTPMATPVIKDIETASDRITVVFTDGSKVVFKADGTCINIQANGVEKTV